jgi:hypothetical protein
MTEFYLGRADSVLFVAEVDGAVAGMGGASVFPGEPATAWAHGIVVRPECQRLGIGAGLAHAAVEWGRMRGARTTLLLATDAGRPVYERLGFTRGDRYGAFDWPALDDAGADGLRIRRADAADATAVRTLDRLATGEHREAFLATLAASTWVAERDHGMPCGFHVACPWGGGPTIAADEAAGAALLRFSAGRQPQPPPRRLGVPETNTAAVKWLAERGRTPQSHVTRMWLGPAPRWRAAMVWGVFNFAVA